MPLRSGIRQVLETVEPAGTRGNNDVLDPGMSRAAMRADDQAIHGSLLIRAVSDKFGSCATVVNIDPKRVMRDGREVWEVQTHGGRKPTG